MFLRYIPPTMLLEGIEEIVGDPDRTERIASALAEVPISVFSTSDGPNSSGASSPRKGQIGVEIGSSVTPLWVATSAGTNSWSAVSWI